MIELGYGARPLALTLPAGLEPEVLPAPAPPPVADLRGALRQALARPIGSRRLSELATPRTRAVVIVSDASRDEPRAELFEAVRAELAVIPDDQLTLAVANGTHQPGAVERLGLPDEVLRRHRVVNHDSRDEAGLVEVGRTARGTRLRVNRCLVEADLIVTTGRIKPHYFAGYGGGTKGIFPGLGHNDDIRQNHRLKADPASALGRADGNPCRDDLEDAAGRLGRDTFMLNVVEAGGVDHRRGGRRAGARPTARACACSSRGWRCGPRRRRWWWCRRRCRSRGASTRRPSWWCRPGCCCATGAW